MDPKDLKPRPKKEDNLKDHQLGSVSVDSTPRQLSITESQAKPGDAATIPQRGSEGESKPGDTATCVQANMVIQPHPNNHAITDYDVSICDCLAVSQTKKETQAHDVHADHSPRSQLKIAQLLLPCRKGKSKAVITPLMQLRKSPAAESRDHHEFDS